jgi:cyclase
MTARTVAPGVSLAVAATLLLALGPAPAAAQERPRPAEPPVSGSIETLHVQGNVWLVAGAGGHIAVQAGDQGVIVVDTGAMDLNDEVIAAIASITEQPIRYVINTSIASQHLGGNAAIASLPGGSTTGASRGALVSVLAQENVFIKMSRPGPDGEPAFPVEAWPSDGYYAPRRGMIFNGEAIDVIHMPNAHSDGDSAVYFRGSNVLVAGDIYTNVSLPMIDYAQGGSFAGLLDALTGMLDITVADDLMEGGTYVIPGHGYVADEADLVEYRDMTFIIRERLRKMIVEDGLTLDEVKAARPVIGWEARYDRPGWTVDMFIEAVYDEFVGERAQ